MSQVLRFDRTGMGATRTRLPSGGLRIQGELTKSGVFEYTQADGKVVREWRSPAEVAKADSLASIDDLPVTIGHPPAGVNADSFGRLNAGHVRDPKADESDSAVLVRGAIVVGRKDAVADVSTGKLCETSMGYACDIDPTPGTTPDGQRYDRAQTNIVYNHVALLPAGGARLGTRLDGAQAPVLRLDAAGNQTTEPPMNSFKIDGKDVPLEGAAAAISTLEAARDAEKARADALTVEVEAFRADAAKGARTALEQTAKAALGKDAKFDGKTDRQVKEAVIAKRMPAIKLDGKDDVYVGAMFDAALAMAAPAPKRGSQELVNAFNLDGDNPFAKKGEPDEDDKDEAFMKKAKDDKKKADSAWERG